MEKEAEYKGRWFAGPLIIVRKDGTSYFTTESYLRTVEKEGKKATVRLDVIKGGD